MLIFLGIVLLFGFCLVAAGLIKGPAAQENNTAGAKRVEAVTVSREKVTLLDELSASLQPGEETTVSFEVPGRLTAMIFDEGDQVGAGQVLARLDASEYSIQLSQAAANMDKAEVEYRQAKEDLGRVEQLYRSKAVPQTDYENAQKNFTLAERDYLQTRQAYALTGGINLLNSPISGTVIAKLTSVGELVEAGAPVYRVGQVNSLKVLLPVPDRDILAWRVGDAVTLSLYDNRREGKVTHIFPSTNQSTGTISVEVTVDNPKRDWFPGQVVGAVRAREEKEGLFIPVEAVLNRGEQKPYLFLADGEKAVKTPVATGGLFGSRLEILSGLKEGDRVVVKGADRLFDGDALQLAGGTKDD